jgi:predicted dehydrogenase
MIFAMRPLRELRHFVDCVRGGATPAVTPEDAVRALRMALAVERAAATGLPVAP